MCTGVRGVSVYGCEGCEVCVVETLTQAQISVRKICVTYMYSLLYFNIIIQ